MMSDYEAPINIQLAEAVRLQVEDNVMRAVREYKINVDKAELLKALSYDRNQYEKGYREAQRDYKSELLKLRDDLYKNDQITMKGLIKLNKFIYGVKE